MGLTTQLFQLHDVAQIFTLKESRLRYWAQTGFVNPSAKVGTRKVYTFCDLLEIKAAKGLLNAGIPLQRVRRNLKALRAALPGEPHPLLRIRCDGNTLQVDEGQTAFNPLSGQLLLDYGIRDLESDIVNVLQIGGQNDVAGEPFEPTPDDDNSDLPEVVDQQAIEHADHDPNSAYTWFLRGCAADEKPDGEDEAINAYRKAIDLDGSLAAAQTNLGNLYYRRGERETAIQCYETACTLDPTQAEAHYNLGNAYDEEGDSEMAIAEYRRALRLDSDFADAHFNLALALEHVGSQVQAATHWRRYIELTSHERDATQWREIASRHISDLVAVQE